MRILGFILFSFLFLSNARAKDCYLVPCEHDTSTLCKIKKNRTPSESVCRVKCFERFIGGSDFTPEIVTRDAEGTITNRRPWSENASLEPDEQVECSIDTSKRQTRLDQRAQREAERKAHKEKIQTLVQDFRQNCIQNWQNRGTQGRETCESALFKKVFGGFGDLNKDALKFNGSN